MAIVTPGFDGGRRQGFVSRLPISQKLPLIAAVLILLVGASISFGLFFELRHIARIGAERRVNDLLVLVGSNQRTGRQLINAARVTAERPALAAFADSSDDAHRYAAYAAMLNRVGRGGPVLLASELRDASGHLLLTTDPGFSSQSTDFPPALADGDTGSVGKLRAVRDSLVYPVSVHLAGVTGPYLVQWRHMGSIGGTAAQSRQLVGTDVTWLIGNTDGSFWSDTRHIVTAPPGDLRHERRPFEYTRLKSDGPVVAGVTPLGDTPWSFGVEFPMRGVLQPAEDFLRTILLVTLACVGLGVLAAGLLARRLTVPLGQLTDAADAVAAGGYTGNIPVNRSDELGRLAVSFDSMAQQVRDSRQRLEDKVADRTRELNDTLHRLEDAQEALVRREKLAMLGQLAGGVGHELRNPLGVMSNAVHYLDMVLQPGPEDVRDYLKLLREQITLSTKIVGDLLDMARITPPQRRVTPVRDIVDAQASRMVMPPSVHFEVALDANLPPVDVDPVQIGQVVFNLLTNAVQAMGDAGGKLRVSASADGHDDVRLVIADSGPGVAPQHLDKIFEPLFTTKARGIGLGLAVSRALAQTNEGDINVDSQPGRGARFTVTLPAAAGVTA